MRNLPLELLENIRDYIETHNDELEGYMDDLIQEINPGLKQLGLEELEVYGEEE